MTVAGNFMKKIKNRLLKREIFQINTSDGILESIANKLIKIHGYVLIIIVLLILFNIQIFNIR